MLPERQRGRCGPHHYTAGGHPPIYERETTTALVGPSAGRWKPQELEVHPVGEQPVPSPSEAPTLESGHDPGVLMGGPAERVRPGVEVDGHAPGVVGDAGIRD